MAKIKSSLEVAMERANRLSRVSEEDIQSMEELKYKVAGQSLLDRFLLNQIPVGSLPDELNRFQGRPKSSVVKGFLKRGGEMLTLDNSLEVLEAMEVVTGGDEIYAGNLAGARQISTRYRRQREETFEKLAESYNGQQLSIIDNIGIRGSAIAGINAHKNPQWKVLSRQVEEEFQQILQPFVAKLGA